MAGLGTHGRMRGTFDGNRVKRLSVNVCPFQLVVKIFVSVLVHNYAVQIFLHSIFILIKAIVYG